MAERKKTRKNHPGGRPTAYRPEYARMAQLCIEDSGFSMYKLAKLFNVTRSTIYRWMEEEKKFSDGVEKGRKVWEGLRIHQSLVKRAVGFSYTETTQEAKPVVIKNTETGEETIYGERLLVTKKVRKYFPPDVAAIKHWQVNRDPERWRDKVDLDGKVELPIGYNDIPEDIRKGIKQLTAKVVERLRERTGD